MRALWRPDSAPTVPAEVLLGPVPVVGLEGRARDRG